MSESPIVRQYLGYLARSSKDGERSFGGSRTMVLVAAAAFGLLLLIIAFNTHTNPYVPAGHEGYVFERPRLLGQGGFRGTVAGPGNYGVLLCRNEVTTIDMRPQTYTEPFRILAKDDLNIGFDFHAVLSVKSGTVRAVVERYGGDNWYQRFVQAPFRTFIRETVQLPREPGDQDRPGQHRRRGPLQARRLPGGEPLRPGQPDRRQHRLSRSGRESRGAQASGPAGAGGKGDPASHRPQGRGDPDRGGQGHRGGAADHQLDPDPDYLQHEAIAAQREMANSPNHTTVYIPVGNNGIPLVQRAHTAR